MFAGHVGAGLLLGRGARTVNAGAFVVAALLLDLLLWCFVLAGWEHVTVPSDFRSTHQASFVFPWSHGLVAACAWSLLAAALAAAWLRARPMARLRVAALIAAAVLSHWLLDALVHVPELPLSGAGSLKLGLGLWRNLPVALALESLLVVAGLWLYLRGSGWAPRRAVVLGALCAALLLLTIAGMTIAPPPPSVTAMAASSLATLVAACGLVFRVARP
jgi:hypothetical protein